MVQTRHTSSPTLPGASLLPNTSAPGSSRTRSLSSSRNVRARGDGTEKAQRCGTSCIGNCRWHAAPITVVACTLATRPKAEPISGTPKSRRLHEAAAIRHQGRFGCFCPMHVAQLREQWKLQQLLGTSPHVDLVMVQAFICRVHPGLQNSTTHRAAAANGGRDLSSVANGMRRTISIGMHALRVLQTLHVVIKCMPAFRIIKTVRNKAAIWSSARSRVQCFSNRYTQQQCEPQYPTLPSPTVGSATSAASCTAAVTWNSFS